jgi:sortase A
MTPRPSVRPGTSTRGATPLLWIERLLLSIAAVSLGWYVFAQAAAAREQASLSSELERQAASIAVPGSAPGAVRPAAGDSHVSGPPAHGALVGRVEVPRLGLSAMAREGVDTRTLKRAVGHVPGTALPGQPGNAAFAGHRDTFFRKLKGVRKGDAIVVTTEAGRYTYTVRETRVVRPSDVSVLDPTGEPAVTLVTCYPFSYIGSAPERFIVRGTLDPADALEGRTGAAPATGRVQPASTSATRE